MQLQPKASLHSLPDGFLYLQDVDPTLLENVRYAGYHNFTGQTWL